VVNRLNTHSIEALTEFLLAQEKLFVLTGAGISTESGIPDYRDKSKRWKGREPIQHQAFINKLSERQRYWARSMIGWQHFSKARPSAAHIVLADLERKGKIHQLVTQNVDRLHQQAGSRRVIDLHGRLDQVICLACRAILSRADIQLKLEQANPIIATLEAKIAPDGDAHLEARDLNHFRIPNCTACGGALMPNVVFYGGSVPSERVGNAMSDLKRSSAMLVVGSSLMVYSAFRFCTAAKALGKPMVAINLGQTRADPMFELMINSKAGETLTQVAQCI